MALGTVNSIDDPSNPVSGTILEDETAKVYPFKDENFPSQGIGVGAPVTYDIDYTVSSPVATNLKSYTPSETIISAPTAGPIKVSTGETLRVKAGGVVTGNINVGNGNLFIEDNGSVVGDITVENQGSVIARKGGNVTGNINVNSGSALKVVNKGVVKGNINVMQANRIFVGNDNGGGTVYGSVTVDRIRKMTITPTSKINP